MMWNFLISLSFHKCMAEYRCGQGIDWPLLAQKNFKEVKSFFGVLGKSQRKIYYLGYDHMNKFRLNSISRLSFCTQFSQYSEKSYLFFQSFPILRKNLPLFPIGFPCNKYEDNGLNCSSVDNSSPNPLQPGL